MTALAARMPAGRYGFRHVARMEWIKLRSLRSTWLTLTLSAVGAVAIGVAVGLNTTHGTEDLTNNAIARDPPRSAVQRGPGSAADDQRVLVRDDQIHAGGCAATTAAAGRQGRGVRRRGAGVRRGGLVHRVLRRRRRLAARHRGASAEPAGGAARGGAGRGRLLPARADRAGAGRDHPALRRDHRRVRTLPD